MEDRETGEHLAELGCDIGQGHLYSRPLPAEPLVAGFDATVVPTACGAAPRSPAAASCRADRI